MSQHLKKYQFSSKFDAIRRAKHHHLCTACRYHQPMNWKNDPCPECGRVDTRQHFGSTLEFHRGCMLLTLSGAGTIANLKFQPRFDLKVNDVKVTTYVADASYTDDKGEYTVEDSKPPKFMTDVAKMKIKLFEAIFRIKVKIPQQQQTKSL